MGLLSDLLAAEGIVDGEDVEWLHLVVGDWQLIADLSFADLVLWVPSRAREDEAGDRDPGLPDFRVIAHCRPTTGSTVYPRDEVGTLASAEEQALLDAAHSEQRIVISQAGEPPLVGAEAVPVVRACLLYTSPSPRDRG